MPRPIPLNKRPLKKLPESLEQEQQATPEAAVELWAIDSHRIGLKPILRRVWVFNGQRPTVVMQQRYQWLYVYAFVHPAGPTYPVAAPAHRECRNLSVPWRSPSLGASRVPSR